MVIDGLVYSSLCDNCCSSGFVSAFLHRIIYESLQEIERLESAWGMESQTPPPITSFADTSTPLTSPPVSPWCNEQTPENRWGETSTNPPPQREKIDQSGTISATLGAYVKDFDVSFAFWAALLWQLSCSLLSLLSLLNFCDYWKFQTAKNFNIFIKKTKSNTMIKISLYKVIQILHFMSHLWIVQKTELTKKPKFTSSRKMLILKNGSKFASQTRRFTVDALNE